MFWGAFLPYWSHQSGLAPCSGSWNFPRFYRLFLQVLDRSKMAHTPGCFGATECLLWLAPRLVSFIAAKLWWTEWSSVALGQSFAWVATVVHGKGNALAHAMTWCATTTVLNQFGDTISSSEKKWAHLLFVPPTFLQRLIRVVKELKTPVKEFKNSSEDFAGLPSSQRLLPKNSNSCQGGKLL